MPYLGKTPSQATRQRYYKTASGGETSLSGTMTVGGTLTFNDGEFVDVKLNGVSLVAGTDYNTTTANTIGGLSALAANDQVEIVVYDTFSVFSGDVDSNLSVGGNLSVTGTSTFSSDVDLQGSAGATLKLTSTDTTGADTELLGQIDFVSSDSSTGSAGTQARIKGVYEDNGDSSGLEFFCGASTGSGTPTLFKRMTLSHDGESPAASIITSDNVANLALISTDADSSSGPELDLIRESASPADDDALGHVAFKGKNDAAETLTYAEIDTILRDASDGTEDAELRLHVRRAGTLREGIMIGPDRVVFNEGSQDIDVRMESDGNTSMFFLDAGNNRIGIGTNSTTNPLTVRGDSATGSSAAIGIIDESNQTGTLGISNAGNFTIKAEDGEVLVSDSAGNSTTVSPHNFEMIPDGVSENMAWAFYSRRGDVEDDFDNTKFIAVDITKTIRTVENLTGEKLIYTGTGSTDDASKVQQDIIQGLVDRIAALETKVAALEAG